MAVEDTAEDWLLQVDTCGERGSVALVRGKSPVAEVLLPERSASFGLLAAIRGLLAAQQLSLESLTAVGVVSGPGSFTGLRVGLAVCKGLCEACKLPLAAVSRLEVLAEKAGLERGLALLRAGPEQVYVRAVYAGAALYERQLEMTGLVSLLGMQELVTAEETLAKRMGAAGIAVRHVALSAADAMQAVRRHLAGGPSDHILADPNYLRDEGSIYVSARTRS